MSNPTDALPVATTSEDRLMPAVTYGLYFIGLFSAVPIFVGAIVAYVVRAKAGPAMQTHYEYLIRTFWGALLWTVIGGVLILIGAPLSLILVGIPIFVLGWTVLGLVYLWILLRLVIGAIHLLQGEAHPRPRAYVV